MASFCPSSKSLAASFTQEDNWLPWRFHTGCPHCETSWCNPWRPSSFPSCSWQASKLFRRAFRSPRQAHRGRGESSCTRGSWRHRCGRNGMLPSWRRWQQRPGRLRRPPFEASPRSHAAKCRCSPCMWHRHATPWTWWGKKKNLNEQPALLFLMGLSLMVLLLHC